MGNTGWRSAVKQKARMRIKGHIGKLFVVSLVYGAIRLVLTSQNTPPWEDTFLWFPAIPLDLVGMLLLNPPLLLGLTYVYLDTHQGQPIKVRTLFDGFSDFGRVVWFNLLLSVYLILWSLLCVVPGIIKAISYSQSYFLMAERPELRGSAAITESRRLMQGHKWEYFVFQLSFLPWWLLVAVTCGIAGIYVFPYYETALAGYYRRLVDSAS